MQDDGRLNDGIALLSDETSLQHQELGVFADWTPPSKVLGTALSTLISVATHCCLLAFVILAIEDQPGAISTPTDAISIELIASEVLDSVENATSVTAAQAASVSAKAGAAEDSPADQKVSPEPPEPIARENPQEKQVERETAVTNVETVRPLDPTDEISDPESDEPAPEIAKSTEAQPVQPEERAVAENRPRDQEKPRQQRSRPASKGGPQSKSAKGSAASSGRVSASAGALQNYAGLVRARVAARRPGGAGRRGTVIVTFAVTRSGGLGHASISSSSGDAALDQSVLSAVRSAAPFPAPPAGAPPASLRFRMPFYFR